MPQEVLVPLAGSQPMDAQHSCPLGKGPPSRRANLFTSAQRLTADAPDPRGARGPVLACKMCGGGWMVA